jgi:hypothetical protein
MDAGTEHDQADAPMLSRSEPTAELRGECPRKILNVLDAVSMARDKTRIGLVNEILGAWAEKVLHETMLVQRVSGVHPIVSDAAGGTQPLRVVGEVKAS